MITGPQGSGKTTQVNNIADKLGLCRVKVGELLRQLAQIDDKLGQKIHADIKEGRLTDNRIVAQVLTQELSLPKCANGYVVDGYPRSIEQLKEFDPGYDLVIYLDISLEEANKRLLNRGREDDTPEAIKRRFEWFEKETEKLVDYYHSQGNLIRVDGNQPIEKVSEEIVAALKQYGQHQD